MSSDGAQYVPALVYAGPTAYKHIAKGKKDLYVPFHIAIQCEREGRPTPPEHTWRYSVSPDERQLVFFYNTATKKSVWTLPAVDEAGQQRELTKEETMRSEGRTLSAATTAQSERVAAAAAVEASSASKPSLESAPTVRSSPALPPRAATATTTAVTTSTDTEKARVSPTTTTTTTTTTAATTTEPLSAVQARLAAWRAKQKNPSAPEQVESGGPPSAARAATEPPSHASREGSRDTGDAPVATAQTSSNPQPQQEPASEPSPEPAAVAVQAPSIVKAEAAQDDPDKTGTASPSSAAPIVAAVSPPTAADALSAEEEELRRAELVLQAEKLAALRAEALAAQQQWRARQAQAYEEEERARLVQRRRCVEQARLAQEEAIAKARSEALAREEVKKAERDATQQVNGFLQSADKMKAAEAQTQEATTAFAVALASQLKVAATARPQPPQDQPKVSPAVLTEVSTNNKNDANNNSTTKPAPKRITATVRYDPTFIYTGDLLYMGDVPRTVDQPPQPRLTQTESLLIHATPDGAGKLAIASAGRHDAGGDDAYYYSGAWRQGVPHGRGTLSLPHSVVQGEWVEGRLGSKDGPSPAEVQTKHMRGLVNLRDGAASGPAHVELDNGALFTGFLHDGRPTARGASVLLPNGDLIEWLTPTASTRAALDGLSPSGPAAKPATKSPHSAAEGSGACRLQCANGDLYVGEVQGFVPHGIGHYVFDKDGHEYRGHFSHGWMEGHGTYSFANGDVYIGDLRRGVFDGHGALLKKGVFLYEGDWSDGDMHGHGSVTFADTGDVWEGTFDHNKRAHGEYTHCQWRPPQTPSASAWRPHKS